MATEETQRTDAAGGLKVSPKSNLIRYARHFMLFELSILLLCALYAISKGGPEQAVGEIMANPTTILPMLALGIGAWIPHFMLLFLIRHIREANICLTAIAGGALFVLGFIICDLINLYGPASVAMSVPQLDGVGSIIAFAIVSVVGVAAIALNTRKLIAG